MIATLDDVIDEILDTAGIYGAHGSMDEIDGSEYPCPKKLKDMCRVCASSYLRNSIESAIDIEQRLYGRKANDTTPA